MRILLVWEEIPEQVTLYLLGDLNQEEYDQIVKAHGHYVNTDSESEEVLWVMEFILHMEDCRIEGPYETKESIMIVVAGFAC